MRGLPGSGTKYCISRAPVSHRKDPDFLVFSRCVGERLLWRWCIGRSLKILADVNRDVFILTKFLATPWRIKELICVIYLRAWSKNGQSK